jgi:CheY-like chemotaxis protein
MTTGTHRIFLVEDNAGDVYLLQAALQEQGIEHEIEHYVTADAAINAINSLGKDGRQLPHVILLDYNLPRGDGCDILAAAAENPALASVPKAVLTSSMSPNHRERALQFGAACFIIKPVSLDEFMSQVGGMVADLLLPIK